MEQELRKKVYESVLEYYQESIKLKKKSDYIPASGKSLDEDDLLAMIDASLDMWLTTGRFNKQFEKEFSSYLGVKHTLTTNSGSSANLLALSALCSHKLGDRQIKPGDEVITVASCFPTTLNPIIQQGLIPVFVDCTLANCNINVEQIETAITSKTKAIMLAHTLGMPFDLDKILEICQKHSLWLIEDSCDALGAEYKNRKVGTVGHIGTFSFYPAHHITMGEGGAVVTNNTELYRIIMSLRDWGRDCWCSPGQDNSCKKRFNMQLGKLPQGYDHKYTYSHVGYNLKITDWQAALGVSQLKKLPLFLEKRRKNAQLLLDELEKFSDYFYLPQSLENTKSSWFGFLLTLKENLYFTKYELITYLENNNIGTRELFAGNILRQPMLTENLISLKIKNSELLCSSELNDNDYALLPMSEYIMKNSFWLGVAQNLEKEDILKTILVIENFISQAAKGNK